MSVNGEVKYFYCHKNEPLQETLNKMKYGIKQLEANVNVIVHGAFVCVESKTTPVDQS